MQVEVETNKMHQQIAEQFQVLGCTPSPDVLEKCAELCYTYKFTDAMEFVAQWVTYSVSNLDGADPTIPLLLEMERKEFTMKRGKDLIAAQFQQKKPIHLSDSGADDSPSGSASNNLDGADHIMDPNGCMTPRTKKVENYKAIISTLLLSSSSSSSSSDEEDFMFLLGPDSDFIDCNSFFLKKERHSVPNFVEDVVANYTDDEFRRHFRVSRKTAERITEMYACSRHIKKRTNRSGRKPLSAQSQCLAFLWFAGNKNTYREVSNLFNMTPSSAYRCQTSFLEFLFEISAKYIKMPSTSSEKEETSREFAKLAGFENVLGCIDGSYIYIRAPAHKIRSTYVNRHGLISITLQGICDANKKFLDVFVGASSKIHDSRIFKLSHIAKYIPSICGKKYHILGDAAYPLREYLLTPYRDFGDLTECQQVYNKKHCQTRVKIENCFGLLKQRFRQLVRLDYLSVMRMSKFVLGCCVLHNLCFDEGDLWLDIDDANNALATQNHRGTSEETTESLLENDLLHKGEIKRDKIAQSI